MTVNSKFNPYFSIFQNSNQQVLNQNQKLRFNQFNYSTTEIKELHLENENLFVQVKAARKQKVLEAELKDLIMSKKAKSRIAVTSLE